MIPTNNDYEEPIIQDFKVFTEKDLPTKTYKMHLSRERVSGRTDDLEAMKQVIFKIINTERYHYPNVYSNNYGIELQDLFGMPIPYVMLVVQERIKEALLWDERIVAVTNFMFEHDKGKLLVRFTAKTIFGDIDDQELQVNV